jgi:hypothetical protein
VRCEEFSQQERGERTKRIRPFIRMTNEAEIDDNETLSGTGSALLARRHEESINEHLLR